MNFTDVQESVSLSLFWTLSGATTTQKDGIQKCQNTMTATLGGMMPVNIMTSKCIDSKKKD